MKNRPSEPTARPSDTCESSNKMKRASMYPLFPGSSSIKIRVRPQYTHIPSEGKEKEIRAPEALLGCSVLLLIAVLVIILLYYMTS